MLAKISHHFQSVFFMKLDAGLMTSLPASDPGSTAVWGSKRINPRPQSCLCLTWSGYPSNDDDECFSFLFTSFYLYIYPPDSQESDGGVNT